MINTGTGKGLNRRGQSTCLCPLNEENYKNGSGTAKRTISPRGQKRKGIQVTRSPILACSTKNTKQGTYKGEGAHTEYQMADVCKKREFEKQSADAEAKKGLTFKAKPSI